MKSVQVRRRRLRLNPAAYRELCVEVLARDGWRCQHCGTLRDLQIHHLCFRSRLGEDSRENLITLCTNCHNKVHRAGQ